jgi:hypothetical protein
MLGATNNQAGLSGAAVVVLILVAAWVCIGGLIGWAIAKNKGHGTAGFFLGALLGWIGWIIAALLSPTPEAEARQIARTHAHLAVISQQYRSFGAAPAPNGVQPGWHPDPHGRFEFRYWDGSRWTANASRNGQQFTDPV